MSTTLVERGPAAELSDCRQEGIFGLKARIENLQGYERVVAERMLYVDEGFGTINPPPEMVPWIEKQFEPDGLERVKNQKIVRVSNKITREGALFNDLRACRPMQEDDPSQLEELIEKGREKDPFAFPLTGTPEDDFGRIWGRHSITASNVAKYDIRHGLVIFNEFHPLHLTEEGVVDSFRVVRQYWRKSHEQDPRANYPLVIWNCLWKSAASVIHGHKQPVLARGRHYEGPERLREDALFYRKNYGANYFTDEAYLYETLGLLIRRNGAVIMADLTPIKENGVKIYAEKFDDELSRTIYHLLDRYINRLRVRSFNLIMATPPLEEVSGEDWSNFPVVVQLVDRGDPTNRTADMGGVEIGGKMSVVSSDPYKVHAALI